MEQLQVLLLSIPRYLSYTPIHITLLKLLLLLHVNFDLGHRNIDWY
jgi:hypothetical protein